ncbi:PREDICTED: uncharacterized protein LOC105557885 isoform X2 [Vollenhovia emeryi]|uniref:uncharacterized protein LOC105557885 isoform X2 n=1 Tax=Vollenhovia emeryi TaxID=411798 RepID=UPI0005F5255C|nr:PREDICTED: uncharacterized protein LOC105557885 isoform X2 [Vollenhovia emeryi]
MICIKTLHVSLNRILLLIVGLWPYQQSKFVYLQVILFFVILATFILCQLATFLTLKCTPDLIINVLSSTLFFATFIIKYISFSINTKMVKHLLEQMQHMYNELTDENELNIITKYSNYARHYTITLLMLLVSVLFLITFCLFWPHIFNLLFFLNETRSCSSLPVITEYFIDQEKYVYFILFHTYAAYIIGAITMLATGTLLIVCLQHACGLFHIASYRVEQAMGFEILRKNSWKKEKLIYKGLIYAVDMHRKAMKFSDLMLSKFKIFQVISFDFNTVEILLRILYIIVDIVYVMVANYLGQEILDHNNDVYISVYKVQWYMAPLQIQKLILFLLQRSTKAYTMNIAGLFVGSLEGAATMLSTMLSYFTVLHSTQN